MGIPSEVTQKRRLCYFVQSSETDVHGPDSPRVEPVQSSSAVDVHGPTVAISVSLLLVLCGTFLQTFNFNFLGLAGYALGPEAGR